MDRNHCCSSMIIYNFYLIGIAAFEAKANAPRPIDRDRPLASSVALERVQPDALKRADVIQSFGRVQDWRRLADGSSHLQCRNGLDLLAKLLLGALKVVPLLQIEPEIGTVSAQLPEPQCH